MKIYFKSFLAVLSLLSLVQASQATVRTKDAPTVTLSPKFRELGKIRSGQDYHLKITITNPTTQILSFWALRPDCSCIKARIAEAVLKPQTSTSMAVTYHPPQGAYGFKHYEIKFKVYSQLKGKRVEENSARFQFSAELQAPFLYEPTVLDGGFTLQGKAKEAHGVLKLDPKVHPKWEAEKADVSGGPFTAQIKALSTPGAYDVILQVPESAKAGAYDGKIKITGKGKSGGIFEYPYKAVVGSIWKVSPKTLDMGVLEVSRIKKWKGETLIGQVYGKDFKVLKVEGLPDWLKFDAKKGRAGGILLEWKVDQGRFEKAKGSILPEALVVQTDSKSMSSIEIPFKASWTEAPAVTPIPTVK